MGFGTKEYDVYALIESEVGPVLVGGGRRKKYTVIVGTSFATAQEAAQSVNVKLSNLRPGQKVISIAADAITCCTDDDNMG